MGSRNGFLGFVAILSFLSLFSATSASNSACLILKHLSTHIKASCGTGNSSKQSLFSSVNQSEPAKKVQGNATWRPPPRGWTKCNTDALFHLTSCRSSSTAVFRDHEGRLLTATTSTRFCSSPLAAEALALRDVVMLTKNLQIDKALFETDNLNLIQAIKSKTVIPEIDAVLEDIWEMERELP
ncbi:hypothetical protein PIB30_042326 [Stylosanthes scabra]|uniref:RNase H type-1 domain-containing protein n=1 Tax=Stylosanthes scabra TaxID=79078 RepID=A0ABU6QEN2_9FABA|nr:hypothetical protein [Stylosanthes scabra]